MGCWASREKYEVTREWGGQVGPFFIPEFHSYEILNHQSFFKCVSVGYAGLHESLQPCSRAARKWRENEEMRRKWRENEEMERD